MSHAMREFDPPVAPVVNLGGVDTAEVYVFPASSSQRRLWFLDRLIPGCSAYNIPSVYRLTGRLNVSALEKTFSEIIRRHEILRTTFKAVKNEPMQIIADPQPLRIPVIDLSMLAQSECESRIQRHIANEIRHVFNLATGPLLRMSLLKLNDTEHMLVKNIHHIISDSWSEEIFLREWISLYDSYSQNKPGTLASLPIQYADYGEWQRETLQGEALEKQIAYWKKQLGGDAPNLALPTDRPHPTVASFNGGEVVFTLPGAMAASLKAVAQRENATLFITLLAAFKVLLHRYTSQADITVGTPITNRNRAELENLIGLFLNTLVLRTHLDGGLTFSQTLARVREVTLQAFENQDLPFEALVEILQPERNLAQHPLCQVMFILLREAQNTWTSGGIRIEGVEIEQNTAKMDLVLSLLEKDGEIKGTFIYSTALFERETIERMAGEFRALLEGITDNSACAIDDLPLLTPAEREKILVGWNRTEAPCSLTPVHELIAAQCERTPEAAAIVFGGKSLTYGELLQRSRQLAAHLQALGAEHGALIGLCVERSPEMVVALMGILQSGAAYVPLDPDFPADRIKSMLEDARPPIIITQRSVSRVLPDGMDARIVYLDDEIPAAEFQGVKVDPVRLAYVLFTSGSTGRPKGVQIPHRALINLLESMRREPGLESTDTLLAVTTLSFDIAGLEIFLPLICGAKIVMASRNVAIDPRELSKMIEREGVTVMQATPATWRGMLATDWKGAPKLKILCGGEAMQGDLAEALLARCASLWNVYGPTETTIWSTVQKVTAVSGPVPVGHPIANTTIYILNDKMQPQPVGIYGELYIGGLGVADGYLGREELTAQKFIPDPFGAQGAHLYRTGDLARYQADGAIEFLGRIDHQVKIRGYRIELAEVESTLGRHPAVERCVAVAHADSYGEHRLLAYIVKKTETGDADLRAFLKTKLPEYMVPSVFVFLDALPLTPNGKVDRKALPAIEHSLAKSHDFIAPRTPLEEKLAAIWARVLGIEKIGMHDDFFEMGGHSLMAVTLFAEIEKKLGKNLPLATLFQAPTVGQLAEVIEKEGWEAPWSPLVAIQPNGTREPFFCIHGADGPVLFYNKLGSLLDTGQPVFGLQAQGLDGGRIRHSSLEAMATLYIQEIRKVQPHGPYYLGGYSFGGLLAMEIAQQLSAQGERTALLALFDTNNHMIPARRYTLMERIVLRSRAIARMSFKDKVSYIADRGARKLAVMRMVQKERVNRVFYKLSAKRGEVVPQTHRAMHVRDTNNEAQRNYRPRVYDGKITLFRAENANDGYEFDSELGWGGLATGGIEIHDVPGEHETMFHEPHVRVLAKAVKDCVEKSRIQSAV